MNQKWLKIPKAQNVLNQCWLFAGSFLSVWLTASEVAFQYSLKHMSWWHFMHDLYFNYLTMQPAHSQRQFPFYYFLYQTCSIFQRCLHQYINLIKLWLLKINLFFGCFMYFFRITYLLLLYHFKHHGIYLFVCFSFTSCAGPALCLQLLNYSIMLYQ